MESVGFRGYQPLSVLAVIPRGLFDIKVSEIITLIYELLLPLEVRMESVGFRGYQLLSVLAVIPRGLFDIKVSEIITLIYELLLPLEVRMRWRDAGALLTSER